MENLLKNILINNKSKTQLGKVATYIPGLSDANPSHLGACIIDFDGNIWECGDSRINFTIQSISKPISLMLAILDNGLDYVFQKVGKEPTGDAFNSMIRLETNRIKGKPFNPMINAGAIEVCSMIKGNSVEERFGRILDFFRVITENPNLKMNESIYIGEKNTGNRNRAMAYFLKGEGLLDGNVEDALDIYFRQCSIEVCAVDLAKIGRFFARNGVTSSGTRIIDEATCKIVKSLMVTCGMYDGSGEFATKVGVPSKSGVGGGILSVVPNKYGIGVFSPALDEKGNSAAGVAVLSELSEKLNLNIF